MYSKKLGSLALAAVISIAIALPAFAQGNENRDYQAIQDERDQRKQRDMLVKFLENYPNSQHRPNYDIQLMTLYYSSKDWALMIKHADSFAQAQGAADAKAKSNLFTLAMEASRQLGNTAKYNEFGDMALTADPQNMSVLMTLSRGLAENPPTDAAAKTAAMEKALGYAERAKLVPKSEKLPEAEWLATQSRLHGILGMIYFNQSKWAEAEKEFAEFLKANPKDHVNQYRYGVSVYTQLQQTLANLQALNTEAQKAQKDGLDLTVYIDRLNLRNKEFETQRDLTIDAMAKAFAIGGPFATSAKAILDPLYKQKNGSLDGLDPFIASKKTELEALTPPPAPVVGGGARGATTPPAGAPAGPPRR